MNIGLISIKNIRKYKEKLKIYLDETLEKTILIKEYYTKNQKYEDAAKMRDIEILLRSVNKNSTHNKV